MFYAAGNRSERSRQGAGLAQKLSPPAFRKRETPRFCKTQSRHSDQKLALTSGKLCAVCLAAACDISNLCSRNPGCDSSRNAIETIDNVHPSSHFTDCGPNRLGERCFWLGPFDVLDELRQ
jgi:hypothetical protein